MAHVIEAKLRRPAPAGLDRPRLSAPLTRPGGPGVVVVLAPPGSGKTTLLALAAASAPIAAWCTAGPEDRSGHGFLDHAARALGRALDRDLGRPRTPGGLVDALVTALPPAPAGPPALLVVDDAHELTGGPAEAHLEALLRWRPPGLRIALGTRRPSGLNTPRLEMSGDLLVLDADALRFRSWEVEELFRLVYREPLGPEAAAALTRRTGGWAAGLRLFQLATAGKARAERERAVGDLGGRSRLLKSYLTRTVLDELPADIRDFLVTTSTLGTMTGPRCDALTGRSGSAAVLEGLVSRQFFTTAAEDGRSYRYHQVLQNLLEGLLIEERGAEHAKEVYARGARLLEADGLLAEASRAYALADDPASVARLVQHGDPGLAVEAPDVPGPPDDPWLIVAHARRLHRCGAVEAAVAEYRRAEALIDDSDLQSRCAEERSRAALWLPDGARRSPPAHREASLEESMRQATVRAAGPDPPAPALAQVAGLLLAGRPAAARAALVAAPAGTDTERLVAALLAVALDALDGSAAPDALLGRLEEVLLAAEVADRPWLARLARGAQSAVLLVAGTHDWRAQSCAQLVDECRRDGDRWGALLVSALLGGALAVRGDPAAVTWLEAAAAAAAELGAPVVACWCELLAALVATESRSPQPSARLSRARSRARAAGLADVEPLLSRLVPSRRRHPVALAAGPAEVRVRCLGRFALEIGGEPVTLPEMRPLPRALLMLLALHGGRDVHREVIMTWLWPDAPPDAATHRLHTAASTVRRVLAEAGVPGGDVQRRGGAYRLLGPTCFDVADFEAAVRASARCEAAGDLAGALDHGRRAGELYAGDLLPEVGPEEWVVDARRRLRDSAASAAYAVGALLLRLQGPHDALPAARRAVELDPLRDSAWALLVRVQEAMGDRRAAVATRREHDRVTAELTGEPTGDLTGGSTGGPAGQAARSPGAGKPVIPPPRSPAARRAPV